MDGAKKRTTFRDLALKATDVETHIWPYQFLTAFSIAFLLSPTSRGALVYIAFVAIYELLLYLTCRADDETSWDAWERFGIVCMSLLGFVIGRLTVRHFYVPF